MKETQIIKRAGTYGTRRMKKVTTKILSLFLSLILVIALFPISAFAVDNPYDIDIAGSWESLGTDNYDDPVYLVTLPAGTTQVSFSSTASTYKVEGVYDFFNNPISDATITLSDTYVVTADEIAEKRDGYGFDTIYANLPAGKYYGFNVYDETDGYYPYYFVKVAESDTSLDSIEFYAGSEKLQYSYADNTYTYSITVPDTTSYISVKAANELPTVITSADENYAISDGSVNLEDQGWESWPSASYDSSTKSFTLPFTSSDRETYWKNNGQLQIDMYDEEISTCYTLIVQIGENGSGEETVPFTVSVGGTAYEAEKTELEGYDLGGGSSVSLPIYKVVVPSDSTLSISTTESNLKLEDLNYASTPLDFPATITPDDYSKYKIPYYTGSGSSAGYLQDLFGDGITTAVDVTQTILYFEFSSDTTSYVGEYGLFVQVGDADSSSVGDDVTIGLNSTGAIQGTYDSIVSDPISVNGKFTTTVTTTYVKTANKNDMIILDNTAGVTITPTKNSGLTSSSSALIGKVTRNIADINTDNRYSATAEELKAAGLTNFDSTCYGYYFICIKFDDTNQFAILVQLRNQKTAAVDKTALNKVISNAPNVTSDTAYYHENDRYNGKTTSEDGFWADYQTALTAAKTVSGYASPTQKMVDNAADALTAAIGNLIPTTQINATALYEAVTGSQNLVWWGETAIPRPDNWTGEDELNVTQSNTSVVTWSPFQAALTDGQALLDSLYDDDGNPTSANTSTDTALAQQAADDASALNSAVAALDPRTDDAGVSRSETALAGINLYANTLYNADQMTESDYTANSWKAFTEARDAALDVLETQKSFAGMGARVSAAHQQAFAKLRAACYGLVNVKDSITVHFSAVDNYAVRKDADSMAVNTRDLTLSAGATVSDALSAAGVAPTTEGRIYSNLDYYINGVSYVSIPKSSVIALISNVKLRDGDTLVVALEAPPTYTNASGSIGIDTDVLPEYETVVVSDGTVPAGEAFNVTVTADGSAPTNRTGKASPLSGATVYSSAACETEDAARTAPVTQSTGTVTDENGTASVKLYAEGWYALNVFDLSEDGGVCNGKTVFIQVTAATDSAAVKTDLKNELTTLAAEYDESFFTAADWQAIQDAEAAALTAIDSADTIGGAYSAQRTAVNTITAIQTAAAKTNTDNLAAFRKILNILPDDTAKIDKSADWRISSLITRYTNMTEYQLQQLTPLEIEKYEKIKEINTNGLPDAANYNLSFETVVESDSDADRQALSDMVQWLEDNTPSDDVYDVSSQTLAAFGSFNTVKYDFSKRGYALTPATALPAFTSNVSVCVNPDYAAYFHVRNNDLPADVDWSISDENITMTSTNTIGVMKGNMTYTVNGSAYEVKSVTVDGVDESNLAGISLPFIDTSTYKDKTQDAILLYISDSFRQFTMPYDDVKVTITWGPVSGTADEITAAKDAAKSAVETAYAGYDLTKYDTDGQAALLQAKTDGLASVEAAASVEAVKTARQAALAAMAAVSKASSESGGTTVELPDYGKTVGQVHITVENNTFSGGAFTGKILDGWYDLCAKDTMMTSVLKALKTSGYSWTGTGGTGYNITYLASIYIDANSNGKYDDGEEKLGEFDGDPGSGWMGTLNDWFVNAGFNEFGAANTGNNALENGDIIDVVYTQNLGVDVGGTWGNSDTSLSALKIDGGTLTPDFDSDTQTYSLIISGDKTNVTVTPNAVNKNYLVKTFLNTYNSDAAFYKRTETICVKSGDVIYVGCGEYSWPSMNNQSEDAISYTGTKYTINVYSSGKDGIQARINALPDASNITLSNYKTYQKTVETLRTAYSALSDNAGIDITMLTAAENKITFFSEIDNVKALLTAIPSATTITKSNMYSIASQVETARTAYDALTEEQQQYFTVAAVANYNAAIETLTNLGAFTSSTAPGAITGSSKEPEEEEPSATLTLATTVTNGKASASVSKNDIDTIIKSADENGTKNITITAKTDKSVTKSTVGLPSGSASSMASTGLSLTVETATGTFDLDKETLQTIADSGSGSMEISSEQLDTGSLSEANKALVGDHPVFSLGITVGGSAVTNFKTGTVTVSLPYTPADGENTNNLIVYYIDSDGKAAEMEGAYYSADSKCVVFKTNHFSVFAVAYEEWENPFTDIKTSDWYYGAVKYANKNSLFAGITNTTFGPDTAMTRAMLVTVLYRLKGEPAVTGTNAFTDVEDGQWYTNAVIWATDNNIASGYGGGLFGTNDAVTREQMAAILYNYAKYSGCDVTSTADLTAYTDTNDISSWAETAMNWAVAKGLISGVTTTTLVPGGSATRAQVATILMRFDKNVTA